MIKVSIIIPIHNSAKYLERCIGSILSQTLTDIEVICIDDGSTDNTRKILKKYQIDSRFKFLFQESLGPATARNKGLSLAQGEYISFIDSDDFIEEDFLLNLHSSAIKNDADIACSGVVRENYKRKTILLEYNDFELIEDLSTKCKKVGFPKYNFVWNKIYKRSFLSDNNISFIDGIIYEDMCFTPLALEKSRKLVIVPNTIYHYWKHPRSLIKKNTDKTRADKIFAYKTLLAFCKKHNINFSENFLPQKREFKFLGIKFLESKKYLATLKFYLFGIFKVLEIKDKI